MPYQLDPTTGQKIFANQGGMNPTQVTPTQPTQTSSGLLGGMNMNDLQTILGLGAIGKKDYSSAWNILKPPTDSTAGTAAENARTKTGISIINDINKTPSNVYKRTGTPEAFVTSLKLTAPGGVGKPFISRKENELADLDNKYFILVQSVMTAIQGSRPSDYDVKSYQDKAGPSIKLPYYVNQQRIDNLLNLMNSKMGLPTTPTKPDLSSYEE